MNMYMKMGELYVNAYLKDCHITAILFLNTMLKFP